MKLFRKIYLQAALGMTLLSSVLLWYLLWETQRQNLADVVQYEQVRIDGKVRGFLSEIRKWEVRQSDAAVKKAVTVQLFRSAFGSQGALLQGEEELLNLSPYSYDLAALEKLVRKETTDIPVSVSRVQTVSGRSILLFYLETQKWGLGSTGDSYEIVLYKDVTDIYQRTQTMLLRGLFFTAAALLLVGFALYRGIYQALRPILELKKAAAAIADGAYGSRVPVQAGDEIGELTVRFNQMAEKVEEHLAALAATNEKQRQLLGSLAHELKTPLTAVIGYADTLLTVQLSDKNRERALGYIRSEGRRLARLSEKMLELTGLYESGETTLELQDVSAGELLARLTDLTAFRRQEKQLRLTVSCESERLVYRVDPDLMMSLLMNLVDNACKASSAQGEIRVTAEAHGITVADHGRGIPEEEVSRVTEAFYMVDKSRSRSAGGVGLGLALCQQIAKLHGGTIQIESEEGKGTRVSVRW